MSRKPANQSDDLGLSLTGSQVGTPVSSARRPGSAKASGRSSSGTGGARAKNASVNGATSSSGSGRKAPGNGSGIKLPISGRSDASSTDQRKKKNEKKSTASDDFLALFESTSQPGKPIKSKPGHRVKPAWATPTNSARSTSTVDSEAGDHVSRATTSKASKFSHSVFQPSSARSNSTVGDDEEEEFVNLNLNVANGRHEGGQRWGGGAGPGGGGGGGGEGGGGSGNPPLSAVSGGSSTPKVPIARSRSDYAMAHGGESSHTATGGEQSRGRQEGSHTAAMRSPRESLSRSFSAQHSLGNANNEFIDSQQDSVSQQKATKLNSIANNMTSQAFSPGAKTPLRSLENSYQNIKPKTPVNQVRRSPQPPQPQPPSQPQVGRNVAEDYVKKCNMAATKLQRWFRRHVKRRRSGEAALRRLLDTKRQEKEEALHEERASHSAQAAREDDRKKTKEDKAREARQQAIEELHKKREAKRLENQKKADEEIVFLQSTGKVSKTPAHKSNITKKPAAGNRAKSAASGGERVPSASRSDDDNERESDRPASGGSTLRQVDAFFQTNHAQNAGASAGDRTGRSGVSSVLNTEDVVPRRAEEVTAAGAGAAAAPPSGEREEGASLATTKTTLDDLMDTLRKLEEEEKFPTGRKDKNEKPRSWLDDLDNDEKEDEATYLSQDRLDRLNDGARMAKDNVKKSGLLTDEKLHSIMNYLDEVDMAERLSEIDQELVRVNQALEKPALLVPSGEELAELEQASAKAAEVTSTMLQQRLELEEKKRTVQTLQRALGQQRELTVRHAKETEREMRQRLDVQKSEYEETIKRHLSFIDQLIDDKKKLNEKCETLVQDLKTVDKKYQDKIKGTQETHSHELHKMKEVQAAAEKLRREKWIDEKTKKIKEMTVRGLEPEIQRLIAKHKAEVKKIKSIHEAELLASDERAGGRYIKMTEELRDQLATEKENACARERDLARQTYEKQLQQEEEAYQQQRRRLYAEVAEEKERLAQQASRQRSELDRLQRQLEETHSTTVSATREEYEKARDEQDARHNAELKQLKEQLAVEKAAWEENYRKKQETWLLAKEREVKEHVRRDRDKEIELVIQRLEEDNQRARQECERVADNRIKRFRDKYEGEIAELERTEKLTMERYNHTKAELIEAQGENERMKVVLKQKDREIAELKMLLDKLNDERDRVSDVIRQEFADRLVATDEENRRLKNAASELKARHKVELERAKAEVDLVQRAKEEEMEEVHKRVKTAIVKKEEVVTQLRQQFEAATKRADHLEGLLEQQRKQLLALGRK